MFRCHRCDSDLPIARDTGRLPMYWTWNFWTCCRTASRNSTETQQRRSQQKANQRAAGDDVRERVSHLVWAGLQVRCSPWSESETASSASSPTSSAETASSSVNQQHGGPSLTLTSCLWLAAHWFLLRT